MRKALSIFAVICVNLVLGSSVAMAAQKTVDQLRAEAEKAKGAEQAKLYSELAVRLVDVANQQFDQGKSVEGQATVQEILQDSVKAHDVAVSSHDKRKEVEIHLRETQRRLENMKRTLAAVDRPPVDQVEKKLAELRQDLLDSMFSPKHKKEGP